MTLTDRELFWILLAGVAFGWRYAYAALLRLSARASGICAIVAIAVGVASMLSIVAMTRYNLPHPNWRSMALVFLFTLSEVVAFVAGYHGRSTWMGRWALALSAWPLVPIVAHVLAGAAKTIAAGGGA